MYKGSVREVPLAMKNHNATQRFLFILVSITLVLSSGLEAEPYTFKAGDTLWELARVRYGDPSLSRDLQLANDIGDVRSIPNGTVIQLPSREVLMELRTVTDPAERQRLLTGGGSSGGGAGPGGNGPGGNGNGRGTGPSAAVVPYNPALGLKSRVTVPQTGVKSQE